MRAREEGRDTTGHSVTLDNPLTVMAAMEAVVGRFIATFTQRYFGK